MPVSKKSFQIGNRFNLIFIPAVGMMCFIFIILFVASSQFLGKPTGGELEKSSPERILIDMTDVVKENSHKLSAQNEIQQQLSESHNSPQLMIRDRRIPSASHAYPSAKTAMAGVSGINGMGGNVHLNPDSSHHSINSETYQDIDANQIKLVAEVPVSTFSIDVDTGGYSNIRRMLNAGYLPQRNQVRIEEMINYFQYDYPHPADSNKPFAIYSNLMPSPWNPRNQLLRIAVQGYEQDVASLPASNIVFLVDVSGSMNSVNKLPLVKRSLALLTRNLRDDDRVAMVTYAGNTQLVLASTAGSEKELINSAIESLNAHGSTAGESGLKLAYAQAKKGFIQGGNNRIVMMTDGDFNVGLSSVEEMIRVVTDARDSGVFLSTVGFGEGNYRGDMMEQMADHGNGQYFYIDSYQEAFSVFERNLRSNLYAIAKDVKIQVEFNPAKVKEYRLVGYENRLLQREDFNNDKVDAGDIGQGHSVTALYEITLSDQPGAIDPLRYGGIQSIEIANNRELGFVKLRYKPINRDTSLLLQHSLDIVSRPQSEQSESFRLAAAVAGFGELLRKSKYLKAEFDYPQLNNMLDKLVSGGPANIAELKQLVLMAESL